MKTSFEEVLKLHKSSFEKKYPSLLKKLLKNTPSGLQEAILYSFNAGGKRLRPIFILESSRIAGINNEKVIAMAAAVESLHTYSLIHDDLPAMDNDDYRRGKLTSHKVFGEDAAILAGDALHSLSYTLLAQSSVSHEVIHYFSLASGIEGMVSGQFLDIHSNKNPGNEKLLKNIQKWKTGKLIEFSILSPFMESKNFSKKKELLKEISNWAQKSGQLFQIIDDLLDYSGTKEELGKTPGKDASQNKLTWVSVYGYEKSYKKAKHTARLLTQKALDIFPDSVFYRELPEYIFSRSH